MANEVLTKPCDGPQNRKGCPHGNKVLNRKRFKRCSLCRKVERRILVAQSAKRMRNHGGPRLGTRLEDQILPLPIKLALSDRLRNLFALAKEAGLRKAA